MGFFCELYPIISPPTKLVPGPSASSTGHGRMPTSAQAAVYSAVRHYLRAIEAAGTDEAKAVMAKMREIPVNDFYTRGGKLREDGRLLHDMYFVQVKTPAESSGPWDYYKIIATIGCGVSACS
jgi:branched-chain amino acid transport system substrate-binding protein